MVSVTLILQFSLPHFSAAINRLQSFINLSRSGHISQLAVITICLLVRNTECSAVDHDDSVLLFTDFQRKLIVV